MPTSLPTMQSLQGQRNSFRVWGGGKAGFKVNCFHAMPINLLLNFVGSWRGGGSCSAPSAPTVSASLTMHPSFFYFI